MKVGVLLAMVVSIAATAKEKDDCKARCAGVHASCVTSCDDGKRNAKSKKQTADCVKNMCEVVVQHCEAECRGHAKKH